MRYLVGMTLVLAATCGVAVGQQWEAQSSGSAEVLNGVWFVDPLRGFVVGNAGTLLETEDGGQTWTPDLLTVDDLGAVAFRDGLLGLIVGDNGRIFRTVDAGQSWTEVPGATVNNLAGVAFGGEALAYAVGRDGTILRSTDDGATWTLVETGTDRYRSVDAHGLRAWAVGNDGVMRATTDGGATWLSLASGTPDDLHDVSFVSDLEGWVAGQSNTLLYTNDGGQSWTSRNATIGVGLNTVFFGNSLLGWAAGALGNAYASIDGAVTWDGEPTPTLEELNALHFVDAFHGWAAGENGIILTRRVPSVTLKLDKDHLEWDTIAGDVFYDVVRGDLSTLLATDGNFTMATELCLADEITTGFVAEPSLPGPGERWWYLVRVNTSGDIGTYDSGSFLQAGLRDAEIASSGAGCP